MINVNEILHRLIAEFQSIEQVTAIAIAGSKYANYQDNLSNININIYYTAPIASEIRNQTLMKFSSQVESDQLFNVEIDHCLLRDFPIDIDLYYFSIKDIENKLIAMMNEGSVNPYDSTRIAYLINDSNIVFDRNNELQTLKQNYTGSYPEQLQHKVIQLQYPKLKESTKSYYGQFEYALNRRDHIHITSLLNDFLKSYLDIIFALNRQFYPIEKQVIQIVEEKCVLLPSLLKEHIELLFIHAGRCDKQLLNVLDVMINQLTNLLKEQQII